MKKHDPDDSEESFDYQLTAEEIKELDENRRKRLSGEMKTYTWEEAKEIITGKRPMLPN